MKNGASFNVNGTLEMVTRNKETDEVVDSFKDHNVITLVGKEELLQLLATPGTTPGIRSITIGSDTGSGTVMNPEMANETMTGADQDVIYQSESDEWTVSFPTQNSVRFLAAMDGEKIMTAYPDVPNVVYNSATLRFGSDEVFAYRRFAPRTISPLVYVDIIWTVTIN